MTIKNLENNISHRPWALPEGKWKYYQEWNNAIFLHWKVSEEELRKFVPEAIEIDTIDGSPWVSLVAFTMEKIRPRNLPQFHPISYFHEINIRTYVKSRHKTGVYFLSIEGSKPLSCWVAKAMSELPYRYSKMTRTNNEYMANNLVLNDIFKLKYKITSSLNEKSKLDLWLTERYALFQDAGESINAFEIHHKEWAMNNLEIDKLSLSYPRFKTLINDSPDKVGYSKGVKVIAWDRLKRNQTDFAQL